MGIHDRDWYREATRQRERTTYNPKAFRGRWMPPPSEGSRNGLPTQYLGAATFWLAVLAVVFTLSHVYLNHKARIVAEAAARAAQQAQLQAEQRSRADAEQAQARQAEFDRQEAARVRAIRERQQSEDSLRQALADGAARRQRAWERYYRPSTTCTDMATLECANAFIRAKRNFEQEYARGLL